VHYPRSLGEFQSWFATDVVYDEAALLSVAS